MSANAETRPVPQGAPPKRRLRNYLLDTRFQLKYTGMVMIVTVAVASVLGWFAYDHSRGQTESMSLTIAMQPDLNPDAAADLEGWARAEDTKVLWSIILGILGLAIALGFTGIIVTHKLVGPAYKMRLLLNQVAEGKLKLQGRLRKGDELQELFEAFANMVESLREAQAREVAELDAAIAHAKEAGIDERDLRAIQEVRDRMNAALD
jgi:methyl-accepting chemotaxis protein